MLLLIVPIILLSIGNCAAKTWISMSVCFNQNAQVHGKSQFPYRKAAILSTDIWRRAFPNVEVLMRVVIVSEATRDLPALGSYVNKLRDVGAEVEVILNYPGLDCVATAQVSRLYAFNSSLNSKLLPGDIIFLSDVDAFPTSKLLLEPLNRPYKIWIYQSGYSEKTGFNFPICFVAMNTSQWASTFTAKNSLLSIEDQISTWIKHDEVLQIHLSKESKSDWAWGLDQRILTTALICGKEPLCRANNVKLYEHCLVHPKPSTHAAQSVDQECFYGNYLNQGNLEHASGNLMWKHFPPYTTTEDLHRAHYLALKDLDLEVTSVTQWNDTDIKLIMKTQVMQVEEKTFLVPYPQGFKVVKNSPGVVRADGDEAQKYIVDKLKISELCAKNPDAFVVDVGGLFGDFGLYAAKMMCKTVIFEPQKSYALNIAKSIVLNGYANHCEVRNEAVSGTKFVSIKESKGGQTFVAPGLSGNNEVPGVSLDNVFKNSKILFLKVDVEGFEGVVVESAKGLFTEGRVMHAVFEYTPAQFEGRSTDYQNFLPLMFQYGAKKCYACHRNQEIIYWIAQSDIVLFYTHVKKIRMQTDVYCSFVEDKTFEAVSKWTTTSGWL